MGMVRRVPTSRAFHGNSTNFYAVVLSVGQPSGQHVRAIGQHVRNSQDSVAALIRPLIKTKEEEGRWLVLSFEEYLLEVFHEVINFKRHPSLVCLGSVSRWLFNGHTSNQFEPALVHLLDEAKRLNAVATVLPGVVLSFFQVAVLSAISVAVATRLPMVVNLVICFAVFVVGNLTPMMVSQSEQVIQNEYVTFVARLVATVLPSLESFNIYAALARGGAVPPAYLGWSLLYGAAYSVATICFAFILFEDRDLA